MFNLDISEINEYIKSDLPFFDMTTHLQDSDGKMASLSIFTREDIIVACSEEAKMVANALECEVVESIPSKRNVKKGETFFVIKGSYENIHKAWRLCQVLFEYSCKIATYTNEMVLKAQKQNPKCQIFGTRKTLPFAKRFSVKSLLCGGGMPHRLGLSDSILFFAQHRAIYKDDDEFFGQIAHFQQKVPERKVIIESENFEDSKKALQSGVDGIQLDKATKSDIEKVVALRDKTYPNVKILCAGGIKVDNVSEYASLGIDAVVTSAMYSCGLANLSSKIKII